MKSKRMFVAFFVALLLAVASGTGWAVKDELQVQALTSTGTAGTFNATTPATPAEPWKYELTVPYGSSLDQLFPIRFTLVNNNTAGDSTIVTLTPSADPLNVIVPSPFIISDNAVSVTYSLEINAANVTSDTTTIVRVDLPAGADRDFKIDHHLIQIKVKVSEPAASCFLSDSSFNLLSDCQGALVEGNSGGTFAIVANAKGRVVATNPGQFYYNLIWANPGAQQTVTIEFSAFGLSPKGTNAVHAAVFDSNGFVADLTNFDMVNEDGTPCGRNGPCTVTVGEGQTLWVDWHLEFSGIGGSSGLISSTCPGNATITATGTLKDSIDQEIASCKAEASGYLKK